MLKKKLIKQSCKKETTPITQVKVRRGWNQKIDLLNKLLVWMYNKDILNKGDKALQDKIFSSYYRYHNDGDFPKILRGKVRSSQGDTAIEYALQEKLQEFIRYILGKYSGKYNRKLFYVDKIIGQLSWLINLLEDEEWDLFCSYWSKRTKMINQRYQSLISKLEQLINQAKKELEKIQPKEQGKNFTFFWRYNKAEEKGVLTPQLINIRNQMRQISRNIIDILEGALKLATLQKKVLGKQGDATGSGVETKMKVQNIKKSR